MHLIIRADGFWRVSKEVGVKGGIYMRTRVAFKADQMQPPVKGWEFGCEGKWQSDPLMECSREVTPVCDEVRAELQKYNFLKIKVKIVIVKTALKD